MPICEDIGTLVPSYHRLGECQSRRGRETGAVHVRGGKHEADLARQRGAHTAALLSAASAVEEAIAGGDGENIPVCFCAAVLKDIPADERSEMLKCACVSCKKQLFHKECLNAALPGFLVEGIDADAGANDITCPECVDAEVDAGDEDADVRGPALADGAPVPVLASFLESCRLEYDIPRYITVLRTEFTATNVSRIRAAAPFADRGGMTIDVAIIERLKEFTDNGWTGNPPCVKFEADGSGSFAKTLWIVLLSPAGRQFLKHNKLVLVCQQLDDTWMSSNNLHLFALMGSDPNCRAMCVPVAFFVYAAGGNTECVVVLPHSYRQKCRGY